MALMGGCIAWSLKKQQTASLSTTEVKYIVLTEGAKQVIWMKRFLENIRLGGEEPTSIWSDNLTAITLSNDSTYHTRTKHINVTYHFIHEKVASNEAVLTYIQLKENPADLMSKGLDLHQH